MYLEVFRAFKFLSDKSQPTQKNLLGETAKLAAELASYLEKASEREKLWKFETEGREFTKILKS